MLAKMASVSHDTFTKAEYVLDNGDDGHQHMTGSHGVAGPSAV